MLTWHCTASHAGESANDRIKLDQNPFFSMDHLAFDLRKLENSQRSKARGQLCG